MPCNVDILCMNQTIGPRAYFLNFLKNQKRDGSICTDFFNEIYELSLKESERILAWRFVSHMGKSLRWI